MNRLFGSMSVRTSILTLLLLPLMALAGLGGWVAWTSWQTSSQMRAISQLAQLAPTISELVHELQKERGASAIFIGSGGQDQARQRLANQRRETDGRLAMFNEALDTFNAVAYGADFAARVKPTRTTVGRLESERASIDANRYKVADMARYYTGTINQLLGLIEPMSSLSTDAKVTGAITGYLAFLQAKERAGLERAMGAGGFGAGVFSSELHRKLINLIGQQHAFLAAFKNQASGEQQQFFQQQMAGEASRDVERLRKIAIDSPFTQDLKDVSGAQWFDAATRRIEQLKTVEDRLSEDLVSLVDDLQASAQTSFLLLAGFLSIMVVTLGGFGVVIAGSISRPIQGIVDAIERYKPGDSLTMPGAERGDELGTLARSLDVIAKTGLESARLKAALEGCQTNVMIANRNREIVYLNPNLQRLLKSAEADIRRELPQFRADELLGVSIDQFHRNPPHQHAMLDKLQTTHTANIELGGLKLQLAVSPVQGDSGERLGTVVEWHDRTAELAALDDIDRIVAAARQGDLEQRLVLEGKEGFMLDLTKGINQLTDVIDGVTRDVGVMLEGFANGDLSRSIKGEYDGRFGELKENANRTAERLAEIVGQIHSAAAEVKNAASEITSGTDDLSHRTENAASSLEETAASMEEMAATVRQNAESSRNASDLAASADQSAKTGGDVVERAVNAMAEINQSAQKITDIISVIDEIAFQTNLLALNASVEAARAGEAGKGFAVVAQEVRQLAQRSAQASSDIKTLIQDSNGQVKNGVELVNQAGTALAEIVGSIGKVAGIVQEISNASQEQAAGVQEINSSVASMDEMTQQNSALVEESSASARSLSEQAGTLAELMTFFKLNREVPASRSAAVRQRRLREPTPVKTSADEDAWAEF